MMRFGWVFAAGMAALAAAPAAAQDLRNKTLIVHLEGPCQHSAEADRKPPRCTDDHKLYFTPGGKILLYYSGTDPNDPGGFIFTPGRTANVTSRQFYSKVPRTFPAQVSASMGGGTLSLRYHFDHSGRWPDGQALRHSQTWAETIAFNGSGGCTVTGYSYRKLLVSGATTLDHYTMQGFTGQTCRVVEGRP